MNAYEKVYKALQTVMVSMPGGLGRYPELYDVVWDALKTKPRNCDIGSPEEQEIRFKKFCSSHHNINNVDGECNACPLNENVKTECEFAWSQMPYE